MIPSYLNPIPSLPKPLGPHKVGTTELEIPVSEIPSSSPVPDQRVATVKFRVFYPATESATLKKSSVPWLPRPQRTWQQAYASFLGANPRVSSFFSYLPFTINYTTLPALADAPLLSRDSPTLFPMAIFSHGLGGNFNTYSSICTSLASFGVVCVAPEHRDGSAPTSLIRSADGSTTAIPYQKLAHSPTAEVLNARNAQLRIRLWELELLFTALTGLNEGKEFTNYASSDTTVPEEMPSFENKLNLRPGQVSWVGHSFGAATIVQFIKSVYYHESLPSLKGTPYENDMDWRPLYKPAANHDLVRQITPSSPVGLLDLWTMPLRGEVTQWLWERPLPCYDRKADDSTTPNVVAIVTAEFYKYTDLLNRMKASLSADPVESMHSFDSRKSSSPSDTSIGVEPTVSPPLDKAALEPELSTERVGSAAASDGVESQSPSPLSSRTSTPSNESMSKERDSSASSSMTSFTPMVESQDGITPKLFLIPNSAHLSQSDFGVLFPRLTRYLMNAQEPEETLNLNVRAVLAVMRGAGLDTAAYRSGEDSNTEIDTILTHRCTEKRFVPVPLTS
ncbi:hypothetical protein PV08_03172 [Exophiala spinifera]|uniref:Putative phospholipase n=1 Tax=Exophiala spinifera TaxID=91928 RepID=A0A0D2BIX8_9EURO|nr:uncharacterized protein PV08_03172 [Exophiala spinifera]KIW18883.1 hypothetical protein PV08_03172 [Exophiala spinifera]